MAEAIANLPFVVDQTAVWPDLLAGVERLLASFPIRILRFRKDDDAWWDAVESAGDASSPGSASPPRD
jgi:hypothetical protein